MSAIRLWSELQADGWSALERWCAHRERESVNLEAKTGALDGSRPRADDLANLAKTSSAFANTEGGVLLFGLETGEGAERDALVAIKPIVRIDDYAARVQDFTRDITTPAIPAVDFLVLRCPTVDDAGVLAVHVPMSDALPFRANGPASVSGRYYLRTGSVSDPMPHQILAALFGRVRSPILRARLRPMASEWLALEVANIGAGAARAALIRIDHGRAVINVHSAIGAWERDEFRQTPDQVVVVLRPGQFVYPRDIGTACSFRVGPASVTLSYRFDADGAQPVIGTETISMPLKATVPLGPPFSLTDDGK